MICLLKLRLMKIRSNPCTLFSYFLPMILLLIVFIITLLSGANIKGEKRGNTAIVPDEPEPLIHSAFMPGYITVSFNETPTKRMVIICNNTDILSKINTTFNSLGILDYLFTFETDEAFGSFWQSDTYANMTIYDNITFSEIIKIEETTYSESGGSSSNKPSYTFSVKTNALEYNQIIQTKSEFNLQTSAFSNIIHKLQQVTGENIFDLQHQAQIFSDIETLLATIYYIIDPNANIPTVTLTHTPFLISGAFNSLITYRFITIVPIFLTAAYFFTIFAFLLWMVEEKEKKLDLFLRRQGISFTNYLLSWFITYLILMILPTIIIAFFFYFKFILSRSFFIILLFQTMYILNLFGMLFFFHTMINKVETGSTMMKIIYLGLCFFSYVITMPNMSRFIKYLFMAFPQVNLVMNFDLFSCLEFFSDITFEHWKIPNYGVSLLDSLLIYFISTILFVLLGCLISLYKNSGKDFATFIKSAFTTNDECQEAKMDMRMSVKMDTHHEALNDMEQKAKNENQTLRIENVSKVFGDYMAVKDFNGELYPNEIFCLLGHNGAGKTTLIKMISGIENISKGNISLNGHSIQTDKQYLYQNIGLCAQDNIFFDYLTVTEHLQLMSELKGCKSDMQEINELIRSIDLIKKRNALCGTLSYGQKRKLCIALALIGKSKLVLLDEPTSGMDVVTKRPLWKFLKNYKANKIIILTTHSLDEAEYLGDRIGIMSEGKFICSGTSSFLKERYPCGFNVNLLYDTTVFNEESKKRFFLSLKEIDPSARVNTNSKYVYSVNFKGNDFIERLFDHIDTTKKEFGIDDYTVTTTTLEDVFLSLNNNNTHDFINDTETSFEEINETNGDNDEFMDEEYENEGNVIPDEDEDPTKAFKSAKFHVQFWGQVKRHFMSLWRSKGNFTIELLYASILIIIFTLALSSFFKTKETEPLDLNQLLTNQKVYYLLYEENSRYTLDIDKIKSTPYYKRHFNATVGEPEFTKMDFTGITPLSSSSEIKNAFMNYTNNTQKCAFVLRHFRDGSYDIINLYNEASSDYFHAIQNILLAYIYNTDINVDITFSNTYAKLPIGKGDLTTQEVTRMLLVFLTILLVWYGYINIGSTLLLIPLKERINNVKHLLYLSGANMLAYWLAFIIIDFVKYALFLIIIAPFIYIMEKNIIWVGSIFITFIPSLTVFTYIFTFMTDNLATAQNLFLGTSMILSVGLPACTIANTYFNNKDGFLLKFGTMFNDNNWLFTFSDLIPNSSMLVAVMRMFWFSMDDYPTKNKLFLFANHAVTFLIQLVVFSLILLLCENRVLGTFGNYIMRRIVLKNTNAQLNDDINTTGALLEEESSFYSRKSKQSKLISDEAPISVVSAEYSNEQEKRVKEPKEKLTTVISALNKTFWICCGKNVKAVNNLYIGLASNEKFGMLGFNGCGKTTTFKCITNEIFYDSGSITLFGKNSSKHFNSIRKMIGYCPQENALFDYLTVHEVISFYRILKKVPGTTKELCEKFGLGKFRKTFITKLSGGNKRKLTFALALMNEPKILLLDEPSTGVDPESRRVMWKCITALNRRSKYNMILTTHSMEEAEILCDTVAWMDKGKFLKVGNPEKLKLECSNGYKLHIKLVLQEEMHEEQYETLNFDELKQYVNDVDKLEGYAVNNKDIKKYRNHLIEIFKILKQEHIMITFLDVGPDFSFWFNIKVGSDKQGELFAKVLQMKYSTMKEIGEINLTMETLENILTGNDSYSSNKFNNHKNYGPALRNNNNNPLLESIPLYSG